MDLKIFNFVEMLFSTGEPTGRQQPVKAANHTEAVETMLLALKLKGKRKASVGATGRVIYPGGPMGNKCWCVTADQIRVTTGRG